MWYEEKKGGYQAMQKWEGESYEQIMLDHSRSTLAGHGKFCLVNVSPCLKYSVEQSILSSSLMMAITYSSSPLSS